MALILPTIMICACCNGEENICTSTTIFLLQTFSGLCAGFVAYTAFRMNLLWIIKGLSIVLTIFSGLLAICYLVLVLIRGSQTVSEYNQQRRSNSARRHQESTNSYELHGWYGGPRDQTEQGRPSSRLSQDSRARILPSSVSRSNNRGWPSARNR